MDRETERKIGRFDARLGRAWPVGAPPGDWIDRHRWWTLAALAWCGERPAGAAAPSCEVLRARQAGALASGCASRAMARGGAFDVAECIAAARRALCPAPPAR